MSTLNTKYYLFKNTFFDRIVVFINLIFVYKKKYIDNMITLLTAIVANNVQNNPRLYQLRKNSLLSILFPLLDPFQNEDSNTMRFETFVYHEPYSI